MKQRVGTTVYSNELASALRPGDKKQLDKLIAQLPDGARKVRVTVAGYVQRRARRGGRPRCVVAAPPQPWLQKRVSCFHSTGCASA